MKKFELWHGDCLELMNNIPDGSVDLVLADPPYGTTACKWDSVIPFEPMWEQLNRIIKPNGAICLFGSEPFSSELRHSNLKKYCYDWIWDKKFGANFVQSKRQPLKTHEIIGVFSKNGKMPTYYPQMVKRDLPITKGGNKQSVAIPIARTKHSELFGSEKKIYTEKFPETQLHYSCRLDRGLHPTQKPTALLEYLIKTYTNEGETVLDFTAGSMSTVIACINTNRNCIAIEKDEHYFSVGCERVHNHILENNIDLCYNQVCGGVCLWQSSKTEQVKDMVDF